MFCLLYWLFRGSRSKFEIIAGVSKYVMLGKSIILSVITNFGSTIKYKIQFLLIVSHVQCRLLTNLNLWYSYKYWILSIFLAHLKSYQDTHLRSTLYNQPPYSEENYLQIRNISLDTISTTANVKMQISQ